MAALDAFSVASSAPSDWVPFLIVVAVETCSTDEYKRAVLKAFCVTPFLDERTLIAVSEAEIWPYKSFPTAQRRPAVQTGCTIELSRTNTLPGRSTH